MTYDITYTCGHHGTVQLFGATPQREQRLRHLETMVCPDCEAKQKAERNAKAARAAKSAGLPDLVGTSKQTAWAETIRAEKLTALGRVMEEAQARSDGLQKPVDMQLLTAACAMVAAQDIAAWWIETRNMDGATLAAKYYRQLQTLFGMEEAPAVRAV